MPLLTSASLNEISPFFEPGAPPPTLPILIAQTEVGHVDPPAKLLATEEIGTGPTVSRFAHPKPRYNPYSKPARPSKPPQKHSPVLPDHEELPSEDDGSDRSTDSEDESAASQLIPKPEGEVTRTRRGGYNLEDALGWDHKRYLLVKKTVKKLMSENLDGSKSISRQKKALVHKVAGMIAEKHTELHRYTNLWPATDFIRLELKYTTSRSKLKHAQK